MANKYFKKGILAILYFVMVVLGIMLIITLLSFVIFSSYTFSFQTLMSGCISIVYIFSYFIVVRRLIFIINSVYDTPFIWDNVKNFKIIGWCLVINAILECLIGYGSGRKHFFQIIATKNGALTPMMIVCIIAALMSFVIAEVFEKAIKIKEDNDLTI